MRRYYKSLCLDSLRTLREAHSELRKAASGDGETLLQLLAEFQQGAIEIGTTIDQTEGENTRAVRELEAYCEKLYQLGQAVSGENADAGICREYCDRLDELLLAAEKEVGGFDEQIEAVFLPYLPSMWDSLEPVWREKNADPAYHAVVIPIPYYDKAPDGTLTQEHWEIDRYPEDVPVTDYHTYSIENSHPEEIYIHNPYDQANHITSVHPFFYAKRLKEYTDKLVYIPYFVLGNVDPCGMGIEDFILTPGVFYSHLVIVQSEEMAYVNTLVKQFGEETRELWDKKIRGTGSPKVERLLSVDQEKLQIPGDWIRIVTKPDGTKKKIILYNTGIAALLRDNEKMIDKIRRVFAFFYEQREEVALLWRPHPLIEATLSSMCSDLHEQYIAIRDEYRSAGWGIYDDSPDLDRAILWSDAYYGDQSSLVWMYQKTGKPIMIQNAYV